VEERVPRRRLEEEVERHLAARFVGGGRRLRGLGGGGARVLGEKRGRAGMGLAGPFIYGRVFAATTLGSLGRPIGSIDPTDLEHIFFWRKCALENQSHCRGK
jgi:hypothetical protein